MGFNNNMQINGDLLHQELHQLAEKLRSTQSTLATAESCTGGLIAKLATDLAGSSDWFCCGLVTYSNESKQNLLGVKQATLEDFGAVSEQTVLEMLEGLFLRTSAHCGIAVSGIAGPAGGSTDKPVGTVWIGTAVRGHAPRAVCYRFEGDREAVRMQSARQAILDVSQLLSRQG